MENLTEKELQKLKTILKKQNKKKRMKTSKKALLTAFIIAISLIIFTMIMVYMGKDTSSLEILAGAGVGILPVMYGIYNHNSTKEKMKHMEENYIPDYDEKEGIY